MAGTRAAKIEITADSRSLTAGLRRASAQMAGFAATSARVVGRYGAASALTLGQTAVGAAKLAGRGALAVGKVAIAGARKAAVGVAAIGTAAVVQAAADVRQFEESLVRLQNAAGKTPAEMTALRTSIRAASKDTGVASQEIVDSISAYVDLTGDFDGATKQVQTFARVGQATATNLSDVAQVSAALQQALRIDPGDMEAAFSALAVEGDRGSVAAKELAPVLAQLGPLMAGFKGGTGLGGLRDLAAAMQVVNKDTNDVNESATKFKSLYYSLQRNSTKLSGYGVRVFNTGPGGVKVMRSFRDILHDIDKSKLAKDPALMVKALSDIKAVAALGSLRAYRDEFESIAKAGEDTGAIGRKLDTYLASPSGTMAKAWNSLKESIASALTPERIKLFADGMKMAAEFAGQIVDHLGTIGAKLGAGFARLLYGDTPEMKKFKEEQKVREQRANQIMLLRGVDHDAAMKQVFNEDAAYKSLRHGDLKNRSSADLQAQRDRVATGIYTNRTQLLGLLDSNIAFARSKEGSSGFRALEHGQGAGWLAAAKRGQMLTQADANMLAAALARAIVSASPAPLFQIDGNTVAHAVGNAQSHRRRPGGHRGG